MGYGFVGGVRDSEGRRGFIQIGDSGIAAVDLTDGVVLWRREGAGRPVAATATRLLTLDRHGKSFVLRLLDAATGADCGQIANFGMPEWAKETGIETDAVQIAASQHPAGVEIAWSVRRPYRGGAPPPAPIAARARDESTGAILIDPESGRTAPASPAVAPSEEAAPAPPDPGPSARAAPDVVALARIGDRVFALKAQARPGQSARVTLEARDARDGSKIWEVPLAEIDAAGPKPPRE